MPSTERKVEQVVHELLKNIAALQPLAVLGEGGCIPHRIIRREAHKPAKQQVIVQLLDQLSLRADAMEDLEQQLSSCSGGIDGRPSLAYSRPKLQLSCFRTSRTSSRMRRSGCRSGTRASGEI